MNTSKPTALWEEHARARRVKIGLIRAKLSMAGFRDNLMLRTIPKGSKILDIGCGGGRPMLSAIGDTYGIDIDEGLLGIARDHYCDVKRCDLAHPFPFNACSFGAVVSTDVFGHINNQAKLNVFPEMFHVLRSGGVTAHVIETTGCRNWVYRVALREVAAYSRGVVCEPDHYYMEEPRTVFTRFRAAGFKNIKVLPIQGFIPEVGSLSSAWKYCERLPMWAKPLRWLDRALSKNAVVREIANLALTPFAAINRLASPDHGLGVIVTAEKP